MEIAFLIRNTMMSAMMSNPPQWSTLGSAGAEPSAYELGSSPSFKRMVTEFTVVEAGYSEPTH
tara:strand:+ start:2707 stop:2895 length:189 start_codon:yes stop_codon:yes gene_type:complete